jgi:hypothetical protein
MPSSLPVCGRSTSTTELKTATDKFSWLYVTSLQGFWLDSIIDMALLKPVQRLADDLCYFDDQVLERVMGIPAPAINVLSAFALLDGKSQDSDFGEFLPGSGLAGKLALWLAALLHWLENFFILQGMSKSSIHYGRKIGHALNQFERLILRPRYLVLFVFITFLVGF